MSHLVSHPFTGATITVIDMYACQTLIIMLYMFEPYAGIFILLYWHALRLSHPPIFPSLSKTCRYQEHRDCSSMRRCPLTTARRCASARWRSWWRRLRSGWMRWSPEARRSLTTVAPASQGVCWSWGSFSGSLSQVRTNDTRDA